MAIPGYGKKHQSGNESEFLIGTVIVNLFTELKPDRFSTYEKQLFRNDL